MKIQNVSKYISLSQEGLVPMLVCPMDQGSLFCNIDDEDTIYLYCITCDFKKDMGIQMYNSIKRHVDAHM